MVFVCVQNCQIITDDSRVFLRIDIGVMWIGDVNTPYDCLIL